jgi:hypothetical protein
MIDDAEDAKDLGWLRDRVSELPDELQNEIMHLFRSADFRVVPLLIDRMIDVRRPESKSPEEIIAKLCNFPVSTAFRVIRDGRKALEVMEEPDGKSQLYSSRHSASATKA